MHLLNWFKRHTFNTGWVWVWNGTILFISNYLSTMKSKWAAHKNRGIFLWYISLSLGWWMCYEFSMSLVLIRNSPAQCAYLTCIPTKQHQWNKYGTVHLLRALCVAIASSQIIDLTSDASCHFHLYFQRWIMPWKKCLFWKERRPRERKKNVGNAFFK